MFSLSPSPSTGSQYTFQVTPTGLLTPVKAGDSSNMVLASPLDIGQPNAQIPDTSLDDLNTSL